MRKKHQKNVSIKRLALYLSAMFVVSAAAQGCEEERLGPDIQKTESGIQLELQEPKDDSQESENVLAELETSDAGMLLPSDKATDRLEEIPISSSLVSKDTLIIINGRLCTGSRNCENAKDVDQCEQMMGCSYVALAGYYFECYGYATPCSAFARQDSCEYQLGCRWVECETDADCRGDAYCNSFGRCLQPKCADDRDCPAGQYCVNPGDSDSKCVNCRNHSDCAGNLYCMNPGSSSAGCVTCRNDLDCLAGLHCLNNASCVECISDSNCPVTEYCKNSSCAPKLNLGGQCSNHNQCLSGRCDSEWWQTLSYTCIPNDREGLVGDYCTHNNHCENLNCVGATATGGGQCTEPGDIGDLCETNAGCNGSRTSRCDNTVDPRKCIPDDGTGRLNEYCTHNNQCNPNLGLVCRVSSGSSLQPGTCRP